MKKSVLLFAILLTSTIMTMPGQTVLDTNKGFTH